MTFESRFPNAIRGGAVFFLAPLLSVIGLGLVMSLTFWIIYQSDLRQSKSLILQDVENSTQGLRLKLRRNEFALNAIARDLGRREISQLNLNVTLKIFSLPARKYYFSHGLICKEVN